MNRRHGLLAFLCTIIAIGAAAVQVPFLSGIACLSAAAEGKTIAARSSVLARIFTPPTAPQIPSDSAGKPSVTLFQVQREHRADDKLKKLSQKNQIPFSVLKAFLAIWSKGEVDEEGFFWGPVPLDGKAQFNANEDNAGLKSTTRMANHLGKLSQQTSTYLGSIIATEVGIMRATRSVKFAAKSANSFPRAMSLSLLAYDRSRAEQKLCSVLGLAAALEARWPVADPDTQMQQGPGTRLAASPGEKIAAPISGKVSFAGENDGGTCVEITTSCDMRATICDMKSSTVKSGQNIKRGFAIGISGPQRPIYNVFLGAHALDSSQFFPPPARGRQELKALTGPAQKPSEPVSDDKDQGDQDP